jgi:hypothetical protein
MTSQMLGEPELTATDLYEQPLTGVILPLIRKEGTQWQGGIGGPLEIKLVFENPEEEASQATVARAMPLPWALSCPGSPSPPSRCPPFRPAAGRWSRRPPATIAFPDQVALHAWSSPQCARRSALKPGRRKSI